jgi:excisionase family DNA binding protein
LTLGEAARFLGVDVTTLRAWADTGKVAAFRTPGRHRRFNRADLEALLDRPTSAVPVRLTSDPSASSAAASRQWLAARPWYASIPDASRTRVRDCCVELMQVVGARGGGATAPGRAAAARRIGAALGREVAAWGLSPAESTEVFLHFKLRVTDAVAASESREGDRLRSVRDVDVLLADVLQAMMEAYESGPGPRRRSAGGTR